MASSTGGLARKLTNLTGTNRPAVVANGTQLALLLPKMPPAVEDPGPSPSRQASSEARSIISESPSWMRAREP
jgi:hypothetical protein